MNKLDSQEELKKKAVELAKLVKHCGTTCRPLGTDLTFAIKELQKDRQCQFWSRTALRCLCAAIEATLFNFRAMAEKMGALAEVQFDPKEVEILSGVQIKNGVQRPKWLSSSDSVKESFRLFAKAVGCPAVVNYREAGFSDLCETFKIRNRLMHPKGPFDIQVSVQDVDTADRAIVWFNKAFTGVIDQCRNHFRKNVEHSIKRHP